MRGSRLRGLRAETPPCCGPFYKRPGQPFGARRGVAAGQLQPASGRDQSGAGTTEIVRSTGMVVIAASLLTTLPALCFGLFAPLAPCLARRFGMERTVMGMMLLLSAGTLLRWAGTSWALFAGAVMAGAAIGVVNVLLPALVKRDFPDRVALMTGLYTMALSVGGAMAAGASAPLTLHLGFWSAALAVWAALHCSPRSRCSRRCRRSSAPQHTSPRSPCY